MNTIQLAIQAIRTAEASLSHQLSKAIESQEFSAARLIVDAMASVAAARTQLGSPNDFSTDAATTGLVSVVGESNQAQVLRAAAATSIPSIRNRASQYPVFERDSERLIKIGWSSKEKRPYEHRVALEVVREICAGFKAAARGGPFLKIEQMDPLKSSNGAEIPSYQVYLVLKWLQHVKAVVRKGIDGYVFAADMSAETIQRLMNSTPERESK